ncbi:KIF1 [Mytilus coruscus]|uniref:KIF1 n=1 Tax=Mytilus coruscus TaxID=42192 RepID=A0A6J8D3N4_MYTCO|nr:KIF1 [Mytilus coruscus]
MQHEEEDQVLLNDHEYSIPNKALETSEKVAEDFIKEAVSINTSINSYNSHDSLDKQLFAKDLSERNWFLDIGREMLQHCPEFLSLLLSAIGDKITAESKLATVCTIYGMLMHCRNTRASAIQKLYTSFCIRYHTDNKNSFLLHRLNKVHITMSDESKRHIMRDLSNHSDEMIKEQIAKGNDGKLNGDNLDIYVTTNDVRMENKNKDYHFLRQISPLIE